MASERMRRRRWIAAALGLAGVVGAACIWIALRPPPKDDMGGGSRERASGRSDRRDGTSNPRSAAAGNDGSRDGTAIAPDSPAPPAPFDMGRRNRPDAIPEVAFASDEHVVDGADGETGSDDEALKPIRSSDGGSTENPSPSVDSRPATRPATTRTAPDAAPQSGAAAIRSAVQRAAAGQLIDARQELNRLLSQSALPAEQSEIRKHLSLLAEQTVFSKQRIDGDPLFESYVVQSGDKLIAIGRRYDVPADAIMLINGIPSADKLRAGATLKAPRGPFHARIVRSQFRLDLYLQDVYVRSFAVGLGADYGTPTGTWRVKDRLSNPTYFPPPSAKDKRVIAPNDPRNPLGEYWIGLEGLSGDAKDAQSFGIHGTIEPDSIGRNASMGCVRLLNEDVEFLFRTLAPGKSMVTVEP